MGIIDKVGALLPWRGERQESPPARGDVLAVSDDLDRRLQRLLEEPRGVAAVAGSRWMPSADVHETDDEVVVTAEVPGLDRDDLALMVTPEGLTIRGEKREEREDERKGFHVAECRYGSFVRTVPLPPGTRPRPGRGGSQEWRADRQVPEGRLAPRHAPRPDQDMIRRPARTSGVGARPGRTPWAR